MRKLFLALSAIALATSAVQADAIADRQAIMKERGGLVGGLAKVAKGEVPFDAAQVLTQLTALNANAEKASAVDVLWAVGTETGGETESSPKIWEDTAGFKAATDKFKADTAAAVAAAPADLAAFQGQFGTITKNCGGCHELYRVKK